MKMNDARYNAILKRLNEVSAFNPKHPNTNHLNEYITASETVLEDDDNDPNAAPGGAPPAGPDPMGGGAPGGDPMGGPGMPPPPGCRCR